MECSSLAQTDKIDLKLSSVSWCLSFPGPSVAQLVAFFSSDSLWVMSFFFLFDSLHPCEQSHIPHCWKSHVATH